MTRQFERELADAARYHARLDAVAKLAMRRYHLTPLQAHALAVRYLQLKYGD